MARRLSLHAPFAITACAALGAIIASAACGAFGGTSSDHSDNGADSGPSNTTDGSASADGSVAIVDSGGSGPDASTTSDGGTIAPSSAPFPCILLPDAGGVMFCNSFDDLDGSTDFTMPKGGSLSDAHSLSPPTSLEVTAAPAAAKPAFAHFAGSIASNWEIQFEVFLPSALPDGTAFAAISFNAATVSLAAIAGGIRVTQGAVTIATSTQVRDAWVRIGMRGSAMTAYVRIGSDVEQSFTIAGNNLGVSLGLPEGNGSTNSAATIYFENVLGTNP